LYGLPLARVLQIFELASEAAVVGHATIFTVLDTYYHVLPGMDGAAASAMEEALS